MVGGRAPNFPVFALAAQAQFSLFLPSPNCPSLPQKALEAEESENLSGLLPRARGPGCLEPGHQPVKTGINHVRTPASIIT